MKYELLALLAIMAPIVWLWLDSVYQAFIKHSDNFTERVFVVWIPAAIAGVFYLAFGKLMGWS